MKFSAFFKELFKFQVLWRIPINSEKCTIMYLQIYKNPRTWFGSRGTLENVMKMLETCEVNRLYFVEELKLINIGQIISIKDGTGGKMHTMFLVSGANMRKRLKNVKKILMV